MATTTRKTYYKELDFSKGMSYDSLIVNTPDGYANVIRNWDPKPEGGLRPREEWTFGSQTGTTSQVYGANSMYWDPVGENVYVFRQANSTTSAVVAKVAEGYSWSTLDSLTMTETINYPVPFASGNNVIVYGSSYFPNSRLRAYTGSGSPVDAETTGLAGLAIAHHKNRFWSGGRTASTLSSRLYYTGLGAYSDWNSSNYIEIAPEDGSRIVDAAVFADGLVIAKRNGLYYLSGDDFYTFRVNRLEGGMGTWGRCIQPTPYGCVIAGAHRVYLWTGGAVQDITGGVNTDYVHNDPQGVSTSYLDKRLYLASNSKIYVRDMETGAWWIHTSSGTSGNEVYDQIRVITKSGYETEYAIFGMPAAWFPTSPSLKGLWYKKYDTNSFSYSPKRDEGSLPPQNFLIHTGYMPLGDGISPVTLKHIYLVYRELPNTGSWAGETGLEVTVTDGNNTDRTKTLTVPIKNKGYATAYRERLDVGMDGLWSIHLHIHHEPEDDEYTTIEINKVVLEYAMENPR